MSDRACAVDDCVKLRHGRNRYCGMHERRLQVWGNLHANPTPVWPAVEPVTPAEEWRPVPGHETNYRVSSEGRILGRRRERSKGGIKKQHVNAHGYWSVSLNAGGEQGTYETHRLVAAAFLGPRPEGAEVRHLDGNKLNCLLANLAYGTRSENAQDTLRHGQNVNHAKTHCPAGHPYEGPNLIVKKTKTGINRQCRTCHHAEQKRRRDRKRTAGPTVNDLATFLLRHIEWIGAQPYADEPAGHFHELTVTAKALAYPSGRRKIDIAPCGIEECKGTLITRTCRTDDLLPAMIWCDQCERKIPPAEWRQLRKTITGVDVDVLLTVAQASEVYGVPVRTMSRWVTDGRLTIADEDEYPTQVHAHEVEELMRILGVLRDSA